MKAWVAVICVVTLSACGTAIQSEDQDHVAIQFNNYADSPVTLQPMADESCAAHDRVAVYQDTTSGEGVLGFLTGLPLEAYYDCRPPYRSS